MFTEILKLVATLPWSVDYDYLINLLDRPCTVPNVPKVHLVFSSPFTAVGFTAMHSVHQALVNQRHCSSLHHLNTEQAGDHQDSFNTSSAGPQSPTGFTTPPMLHLYRSIGVHLPRCTYTVP